MRKTTLQLIGHEGGSKVLQLDVSKDLPKKDAMLLADIYAAMEDVHGLWWTREKRWADR